MTHSFIIHLLLLTRMKYYTFQPVRKRRVRDVFGEWIDEKDLEGRAIEVQIDFNNEHPDSLIIAPKKNENKISESKDLPSRRT